eukprot:scaffold67435_cov100-Phaeocystis_antarctica.AAC.1
MKTSRPVDARLCAAGEDPGLQSELGAEGALYPSRYRRRFAFGAGSLTFSKTPVRSLLTRPRCCWPHAEQVPARARARSVQATAG